MARTKLRKRAVARPPATRARCVVVGVDGSRHAGRAVAHLARWSGGGRVTVVRVLEPRKLPSLSLLPSGVRAAMVGLAQGEFDARVRGARREVEAAAARLRRAGWRAGAAVRVGVPLPELLRAARKERADCLVLGARGAGGVSRFLLGTVSDGALKRAPVPVLIVP